MIARQATRKWYLLQREKGTGATSFANWVVFVDVSLLPRDIIAQWVQQNKTRIKRVVQYSHKTQSK